MPNGKTPDLKKITTQTFIIGGMKDTSIPPRDQRKMYKLIQFSKLEILEKVGHFPHLENPKMFLYFVNDFLN